MDPVGKSPNDPTTQPPFVPPTAAPRQLKNHRRRDELAARERSSTTGTLKVPLAVIAAASKLKATSAPFNARGAARLLENLSAINISERDERSSVASPLDASSLVDSNPSASEQQASSRPGTSSTYISPVHAASQRFSRLHTNATRLSLADSPFFPNTLLEYIEHQKLHTEDVAMESKEKLANMIAESATTVPKVIEFLHGSKQEARDRILGDGRSAVLGLPSIWTAGGLNVKTTTEIASISSITDPKAKLAMPVMRGTAGGNAIKATRTVPDASEGTAAWPSPVEFKLHGEDRIKKYGKKAQRTLPVPVNSQWSLSEGGYERKVWEYSELDKVNLGSPVAAAGGASKLTVATKKAAAINSIDSGINGGLSGCYKALANGGSSVLAGNFNAFNPHFAGLNYSAAGSTEGNIPPGFKHTNMASPNVAASSMASNFNPGFNQNSSATTNLGYASMGGNFVQGYQPGMAVPSDAASVSMGNNFHTNMGISFASFNDHQPSTAVNSSGQIVPLHPHDPSISSGGSNNPFLTMTPKETPILSANEHGQYIFNYANSGAGNNNMHVGGHEFARPQIGQQTYVAAGLGSGQIYGGSISSHLGYGQGAAAQSGAFAGRYPADHGQRREDHGLDIQGQSAGNAVLSVGATRPGAEKTSSEARAQSLGPFGAGEDDEEPPAGGWKFDEEWMRANGHCLEVLDAINKK